MDVKNRHLSTVSSITDGGYTVGGYTSISWYLMSHVWKSSLILAALCLLDVRNGGSPWNAAQATSEKRLISTLLENYKQNGIEGRPVLDTSRPLAVAVGFTLVQLLWYDDRDRIVSLVGWLNLQWRDALLQWNASEYDNVHQVALYPRQIWTPDVVLVNAVSPPKLINDAKLIALHTGLVVWATHVHYQASCSTTGDPGTQQQQQQSQPPASRLRLTPVVDASSSTPFAGFVASDCELRFGSWTLSIDLLTLQPISERLQGASTSVATADDSPPSPPFLAPPLSGTPNMRSSSSTSGSAGGGLQLIQRTAEWDVLVPRLAAVRWQPAYEIQYPWRPGVRYSVVGYRMTVRRRRSPTQLPISNVEQRRSSYGRGVIGKAASRGPSAHSDDPAMMSSDPELYDDTDVGLRPGSTDFTSSDISRWDSAGLPSRRQLPPSPRRNFMPSSLSGATRCYSPDTHQMALGVIVVALTLIVREL